MARLPGYENQRTIGTGSEFLRPRTTRDQTAASFQNIGNTLSSIGGQLAGVDAKLEDKARIAQERIEKIEAERDVLATDTEAKLALQDAQTNISESGKGFYDGFMPSYDKLWQKRLEGAPDRLKPEMELQYYRQREQMAVRVSAIEHNQTNQFVAKVSKEKADSLASSITTGLMAHEDAKVDVDRYVTGLQLPPNADKLMRRQLGMRIDEAQVQKTIALNPDGALRDIKKYATGVPRSAIPNVQTSIEAADRNGVPVNVMLAIVEGESKFNHTEDMSKKINPQTGRPYSSAYGLGQMIDANWKEVGLTKSADPVIQAEATARLLSKRIARMQSLNIDTTPENVWGMHLLGPGGFPAVYNAAQKNPNTPLRDVLLPVMGSRDYQSATTGNGQILKDGATVGQTLNAIKGYVDRNSESAQKKVSYDAGSDPTQPMEVGGVKLGYMTGQDAARYVGKAQEAVQQARDGEMKAWLKQQSDDGLLNAFNRADRTSMDKYAVSTGISVAMNSGSPEAYGQAKAFLEQNKYLPKPFAEEAQLAVLSPDPKKRAMAYDLLSNVEVHQPMGGLRQSGVQPDIANRVEKFIALKAQLGLDNNAAMTIVEREASPEFADRVKRDKDRVKSIVDSVSMSTLETSLDSSRGWLSGTDYGTDAAKANMLSTFRDRVRFHLENNSDRDSAVALAKNEMSKAYGTDNSFGDKRLMHWPPSKILPPGQDGTHKWVAESVTNFVNDSLTANNFKFQVKPKDVYLIGTPETARSVMAGQTPYYEVAYRDNKGKLQSLPGGYRVSAEDYQQKMIDTKLRGEAPKTGPDIATARQQQQRDEQKYAPLTGSARRSTFPISGAPDN